MNRRHFLLGTAATATALSTSRLLLGAEADLRPVINEIEKRHDEAVKRLQTWIRQPSIAAENRGMNEGCELTMQMLRDAGFQHRHQNPNRGTTWNLCHAGRGRATNARPLFHVRREAGDPAEWSSPPWEAALVDKPGFGKVIVGRGAVNQKGPQATFLAALHAIRGAGRKLPVNLFW